MGRAHGYGLRVTATLFVAAAGGHLAQLVELAQRLPPDASDVAVWVTSDHAQSRSLLAGRQVVFVPEVRPRDVSQVMRCVPIARRLHAEWSFTRVISTGSGVALGFLPYLSSRGVRAHYIESSSRMSRPSATGQVLSALPGIRLYTQYEWNAKGRWKFLSGM